MRPSLLPFRELIWTSAAASVEITSGVEARLIEAESQIRANAASGGTYLSILNTLRTTGGVTGLAANLTDPGTQALRLEQLYCERAFWLFGKGHRLGDLRRRVPVDNVPQNSIWLHRPQRLVPALRCKSGRSDLRAATLFLHH